MKSPSEATSMKAITSLLLVLTGVFAVGYAGNLGAMQGLDGWYQLLDKPSWNPPPWLFAPVWAGLYMLVGVGAWQVWRTELCRERGAALILFPVQLLLAALWNWTFFAWQRLNLAFIEMLVLDLCVLMTAWLFLRLRPSAGFLMMPYLAWTLLLTALNFAVWRMNVHPAFTLSP